MSDPTDLSKLSSDELIDEIIYVALECGDRWRYSSEAKAKAHALSVVLKQVVIREASAGTVTFTKDGQNSVVSFDGVAHLEKISDTYFGPYHLVSKETP